MLSVVLNHLSVHDGIRLLKASKALYYGNVSGSKWILDQATNDILGLKTTADMKQAAFEAARAELYRTFAGFGAAWDYYVEVYHEYAHASHMYRTTSYDVRRDGARDDADAPRTDGLRLVGRHAVLDQWRVLGTIRIRVPVVLGRDDRERGVGEALAREHLRLAHLAPVGFGVRREQLHLARVAGRAERQVVKAARPVPVGVRWGVLPALIVDDEHEAVQLVPPLQLEVAVQLVEVALQQRVHPLARVVELGALLPVVHGAVLHPVDVDRGPELVLGLDPAPPAVRARLPAVHRVVLVRPVALKKDTITPNYR